MTNRPLIVTTCLLLSTLQAHAAPLECSKLQTADQRKDADTVRRIERDWLTAELHGHPEYLDCLLDPGYVVIVAKDNVVRSKADLLERVAKNRGKDTAVPPLDTTVAVNGDFATAYSVMHGRKQDGTTYDVRFVDSYYFKDGAWHAFAGVDL